MAMTNQCIWPTRKLKDCIVQLNTGLNPRDNFSLGTGKIKYITAKNLTDSGTIDFSSCDYIDAHAKAIIHRRSDIQKGDILFGSRAPIGHCHLITDEPDYFDVGESIFCIRVNKDVILPEYLCLYLSSNYFVEMASKRVTGSIIKEIRIGDLLDTDVILPPEDIQVQIARCVRGIDDKLINNKDICSNLEAMAKLLYDYWFVQFDFPDENGKPYKSSGGKMVWNDELKREIPAGWEVDRLPNVCDLQYGFPLSTKLFGEDGKGVIRIRDIADNTVSAKTIETVNKEYLTHTGDLLVGMDGNFQMNYWTRDNEIVNQRITRIRQTIMPLMVIKMQIEPYITAKVSSVAKSTVGHLGDADFKKQPILCPNKMDYSLFENALNTIVELRNENQQLTSLRDFLLPMLMNGQVKVGA